MARPPLHGGCISRGDATMCRIARTNGIAAADRQQSTPPAGTAKPAATDRAARDLCSALDDT
jgi:hypothetical protein